MKLGAFSISITVKDLNASKTFYEKLGFEVYAGKMERNYLIMKSGDTIIGLFHGMFDKNVITFNPGWDRSANILQDFDDIREIQADLKAKGVALIQEADPNTTGPASVMLIDPDGNPILIDQHAG